ncbi:MAG: Sec-independent protein translocase protein TatB [Pseudomonadota bacterium]|nr:Sec-independent protein translocase protein TatB [Pseudomonadota bacterium]
MFDIGGWEFMLILILGIVIIGPKELPGALRNITLWIRKARGLAREFQSGIDDIVQEAEFEQIRQDVMEGSDPTGSIADFKDDINQTLDPDGEIEGALSLDDSDEWYSDHEDFNDDPDAEEVAIEASEPVEIEVETASEGEVSPDDGKSGA